MRKSVIISIFVCIFIILIIGSDAIGVFENYLERDARTNHKITDSWEVSMSTNKSLAAMIFYNDTLDDYFFSIYEKRNGISIGYFFKYGGSSGAIMDGIQQFSFSDKGSALISMNKAKISRIEINNDIDIFQIDIDSKRPFAVALKMNCGSVKLYDIKNNEIPITNTEIYR